MNIPSDLALSKTMTTVMKLAYDAGEILKKYHKTSLTIDYKIDEFDPVTIADKESDDLLRCGLSKEFPDDEILSEENPLLPESYGKRVWMIDPLDDTKGFLAGRDSPGVMIGLLENGTPTIGIVYLPFRDEWFVGEIGKGSFKLINGTSARLQVSATTDIVQSVLVGRNIVAGDIRPIDDVISSLSFKSVIPEGCIGAKIGLIASGEADAFIHTNLKAGKWDTLAPEVILTEAGGTITDIDGNRLDYTKPTSGWNRYFIATSTDKLLQQVLKNMAIANKDVQAY